jgi:hypothetical protein
LTDVSSKVKRDEFHLFRAIENPVGYKRFIKTGILERYTGDDCEPARMPQQ